MSTLLDIRQQYALIATRFDRAYIGTAERGDWRHIFGDDLHDYAPTGPQYRTKAEALTALPAAVSSYYGLDVLPKHEQEDASLDAYRSAYLHKNRQVQWLDAPFTDAEAQWAVTIPMTCAEIVEALSNGYVITLHRPTPER